MNREDTSDADWPDILDKRPGTGVVDALHLGLDVRRIVESLPTGLQSVALLLGQMPVQDVCRHTGKSRSRVYQMTKQIREAFVLAGVVPASLHTKANREVGTKGRGATKREPENASRFRLASPGRTDSSNGSQATSSTTTCVSEGLN
jgi:hypothetical protein